MFEPEQYELIDFGGGRKLERFGAELLDRPSPAATGLPVTRPSSWGSATARYTTPGGATGTWEPPAPSDGASPWTVHHDRARLLMQFSASGNVGVFPEQAGNWDWIADQVTRTPQDTSAPPPRVLNLFAYTGGASLAAAAAGAEVTHVDSSGPTVAWAKRNAEASGLADRPVRWIVEDAIAFVARERRRGNIYDGIIADPPTYGHGPKGKPFKFAQHVDDLLGLCGELLGPSRPGNRFLLFSCHAPGFGVADAISTVTDVAPGDGQVTGHPLVLETSDNRQLSAGVAARWTSGED